MMKTSVALCTYNGEKYLREQIRSIMLGIRRPDEIVVCDDGSTDATLAILEEFSAEFPSIFRIFRNSENLGYYKNFEKAIHLCQNEIILLSDQDDIWAPQKVENIINFFEQNPDLDAVFHDMKLLSEQQQESDYLKWKGFTHEEISAAIKNKELFVTLNSRGSFVLGCSLAIRKTALKKYGLKNFPYSHDYFMAQKLTMANSLGFIPRTLSSYRLHEGQVYGLRWKQEDRQELKRTPAEEYYLKNVWTYLKSLEKIEEFQPGINRRSVAFYPKFIANRNHYLKMLPTFSRKKFLAKCVRYGYLDLSLADLFKY